MHAYPESKIVFPVAPPLHLIVHNDFESYICNVTSVICVAKANGRGIPDA